VWPAMCAKPRPVRATVSRDGAASNRVRHASSCAVPPPMNFFSARAVEGGQGLVAGRDSPPANSCARSELCGAPHASFALSRLELAESRAETPGLGAASSGSAKRRRGDHPRPIEAVDALVATDDGVHFIEPPAAGKWRPSAPAVVRGKARGRHARVECHRRSSSPRMARLKARSPRGQSCVEIGAQGSERDPEQSRFSCATKASQGEAARLSRNRVRATASKPHPSRALVWRKRCHRGATAMAISARSPTYARRCRHSRRAFVRADSSSTPLEHAGWARELILGLHKGTGSAHGRQGLAASSQRRGSSGVARCDSENLDRVRSASSSALEPLRAHELRAVPSARYAGPDQIRDVCWVSSRRDGQRA